MSVNTSVKDFAAELKVPVDTLLDQLNLQEYQKVRVRLLFLKKIRKTLQTQKRSCANGRSSK